MASWPTLGVMLLTYKRYEVAERCLRALLEKARYSGPLWVHIADDGSPPVDHGCEQAEELRLIAGGYPQVAQATSSNSGQRGYGASFNLATQRLHLGCEVIMPMEDDWELQRPLDLDPLVMILHDTGLPIDVIRLGYLGFTQELRGQFLHTEAGVMALLDPASTEPHVAAGHVRLETREYERRVGAWPEGLPAGRTEWEWCRRAEAREGVAFPLDLIHPARDPLFAHIGAERLNEHQPTGVADA